MSQKIRVSEVFFSLQGEGVYQGVPSLFLRTFGCNFRCKKFGMEKSAVVTGNNPEVQAVIDNLSSYSKLEDLPLVHTGCDSYAAVYPEFKKLSPMLEIPQLVDRIEQLLPNRKFGSNVHLVITGGEPLLGWQRVYPELLAEIYRRDMDLGHMTFETNGTQKLVPAFFDLLSNYGEVLETTFSISSKLPSSGEKWEDAILPDVIRTYRLATRNTQAYFKWVCSNPDDLEDVKRAVQVYNDAGIKLPVYLMPAGGTELLYHKNKQWLSKVCLAEGFRYSPRLHIDLFGNSWGT